MEGKLLLLLLLLLVLLNAAFFFFQFLSFDRLDAWRFSLISFVLH